jgi:predicted secreted protein
MIQKFVPALALVVFASAHAEAPPPQNVLQLSTSATVEVPQDLLTLGLTTTREASDAQAVQSQLKSAVDAALAEAKKASEPGRMDVRTGVFSVFPRYSSNGKITGWRGTAEVVLEGRDFARITQTASRMSTLAVGNVAFGLSREQRAKVETDAQHAAIDRFKSKATDLSRSFGFTGYTLREVQVSASDAGAIPRYRMAAAQPMSAAEAPVPVEAGKTSVTVNVSGTVQLQ